MGFNTAVLVLNDGLDQLQKYPDEFVSGILENLDKGGDFGVGSHGNPAAVLASEHADHVQLIAVGGNQITRLFIAYNAWRLKLEEEEGQIELLRRWAASLGFDLVASE